MPPRRRSRDPDRARASPRAAGSPIARALLLKKRFLAAGAVAVALALLPASVSAHARLIASSPVPGTLLDAVPAVVTLYFSEPVSPAGRGISVYGPDGRLAGVGSVKASGEQLSVRLELSSPDGTYAVVWTVFSADTHPSRGEFTFSVVHESPVRAPGVEGDVGLVSPLGLAMQSLSRWMHFIGFALGFGSATYALFVARDPRPLRLAGAGVVLMLGGELVGLLAQTASLDPARTFDGDALTSALASPYGRVFSLRIAAAFLLWALLGALGRSSRLRWGVPAIGVALAVVDATAAHATPALPLPIDLALNALHVGAMAIWLGGLVASLVVPSAGFGRVAIWSTVLLVVSGAALALLHFAQPIELMTTPYGLSLVIKLPLVAAALWLAWHGRRRWELAAVALIVAAASVLISLPPPR